MEAIINNHHLLRIIIEVMDGGLRIEVALLLLFDPRNSLLLEDLVLLLIPHLMALPILLAFLLLSIIFILFPFLL